MSAGSIVIDLLLRTGSLETDTARARKSLVKFEQEAMRVGKVVATAFTAVVAATAAVVKSQINAADAASKAAQAAGISTESYTALSYAADLAGVQQETLSKVFSKLNTDIATNDKLLRSMGIALQDSTGKARTADDVLEDLAGAFSTMRDGAEKSALAAKIFGERFGPQMVPFLNQGKEGIKALKDEAERLGIVISTDTGKKAEEFNDNMTRLKTAVQGAAQTITEQLLPTLVKVSERLVQNIKDIGLFQGAFVTLFQSLFGGTDPQDILRERLAKTQTGIASLNEELTELALAGKTDTKRFSVLAEELGKLEKQAALATKEIGVFDKMAELARPKAPAATGNVPPVAGPVRTPGRTRSTEATSELQRYLDGLQQQLEATRNLSVEETVLADIQAKRLKLLAGESAEPLLAIARQIDQVRALAEAEAARAQAVQQGSAMTLQAQQAALAEVDAIINANDALVDEIALIGADRAAHSALEQARLSSIITMREQQLLALQNAGATQIETDAIAQQIGLLKKRQGLLKARDDKDAMQGLIDNAQTFADVLSRGIGAAVINFRDLRSIIGSVEQQLLQMATQLLVIEPLKKSLSGMLSPGGSSGGFFDFLGSLFGFRAAGGPVDAGRPYVVGEQGPEMFVPRSAGTILPAGQTAKMRQGSTTTNNYFTINGPTNRQTQEQIASAAGRGVQRALARGTS
jgi:hypothetical protein